jgi:hypothetical protein
MTKNVSKVSEPAPTKEAVNASSIPRPALAALQKEAGDRPLQKLTKETRGDGSVTFQANFQTVSGVNAVEVDSLGNVLGHFNRIDQPSGSGP